MDGTLLAILSGRDRPGVTAALFDALRHTRSVVLDMEQLVVRGRLILAVLLGVEESDIGSVRAVVHEVAGSVGMEVETLPGARETVAARRGRIHVTVIGRPLPPGAIADLTSELAARGWNIDRIRRIASYPVTAVVFEGSGDEDLSGLRRALSEKSRALGVDVAVQHAGLDRRGQRLVVMDVDSTVIQDEVIDLLAAAAGQGDAVAAITEKAMSGEIDFAESLRQRVAALEGLPASALDEVANAVTLTPGARTLCRTLKRLGFHVCLVSGGFEEVVVPVTAELEVDRIRANRLEVVDGRLTGRVVGPIIDRAGKRRALEEFASEFDIPLSRTVAIGDGANDLDMLEAAGLGVAFNAKPAVRAAADTSLSVPYLDSVLFLLGITREEIEEADAADPSAI
ncbi:MAG: phosphoserine phosphatase SerB [Actinomycetales bacterium mxb001]|nr:MAG: phosphoserine phosphatase SerB [Actinomycetales bacterium mxb001]